MTRELVDPEIVICSAIRLPDGRIFRGHRHGDCLRTAMKLVQWEHTLQVQKALKEHQFDVSFALTLDSDQGWRSDMGRDQGFITSRNRYVSRVEGLALQVAAGIESVARGGYRHPNLFSEDLY